MLVVDDCCSHYFHFNVAGGRLQSLTTSLGFCSSLASCSKVGNFTRKTNQQKKKKNKLKKDENEKQREICAQACIMQYFETAHLSLACKSLLNIRLFYELC